MKIVPIFFNSMINITVITTQGCESCNMLVKIIKYYLRVTKSKDIKVNIEDVIDSKYVKNRLVQVSDFPSTVFEVKGFIYKVVTGTMSLSEIGKHINVGRVHQNDDFFGSCEHLTAQMNNLSSQ